MKAFITVSTLFEAWCLGLFII